jgi:hypothetical protein
MVGDYWYTAWVNAGQPDLDILIDERSIFSDEQLSPESLGKELRQHESGIQN